MTADVKSRQEKEEEEGEVTSANNVKGEFTIWFKFCIILAGCFLRVSISGLEIGESFQLSSVLPSKSTPWGFKSGVNLLLQVEE